jgi:hypothetical protein
MVMLEGDAGLPARRPAVQRWTVMVAVAVAAVAVCAVALSVRHNTANLVDRPNVSAYACRGPPVPLSCWGTDAQCDNFGLCMC